MRYRLFYYEVTMEITSKDINQSIKEYQELGRPQAYRNIIAMSNLRLMKWCLNKLGYYNMTNIDNEELEQESFILMLNAIDKFDVSRGSFSTYLLMYLKNSLRKVLQYNQDISLEQPINDLDGEEITLQDTMQDDKTTSEVLNIEHKTLDTYVRNEIKTTLGKEIADIVFYKYGVGSPVKTIKQLANIYNATEKDINKILIKARQKLRNNKDLYYYLMDYTNREYHYGGSIILYSGRTNKIKDTTGDNAVRFSELKTKLENDYYISREKKELQKQIDEWFKKNLKTS